MCALNERITIEQVNTAAESYDGTKYSDREQEIEQAYEQIRQRGYLLKREFINIVRWKNLRFQTNRNVKLWNLNDKRMIQSTTKKAFSTESEIEAIVLLTGLKGVNVRTATALLHFGRKDRSPILDLNALTALNAPRNVRKSGDPLRDLRLYPCYAAAVRRIRQRLNVPMRKLDKALFITGKEKNKRRN